MNRSSIKKTLKQSAGGADFINHEQLKRSIGCGNDRAYEITEGLTFFKSGRRKLYSIEEVAERIWRNCEVADSAEI